MPTASEFYEFVTNIMQTKYTEGYANEKRRLRTKAITELDAAIHNKYPDIADYRILDDTGAAYSSFYVFAGGTSLLIPLLLIDTKSFNIKRTYYTNIKWTTDVQKLNVDLDNCPFETLMEKAIEQRHSDIKRSSKDMIFRYIGQIQDELHIMKEYDVDIQKVNDKLKDFEMTLTLL